MATDFKPIRVTAPVRGAHEDLNHLTVPAGGWQTCDEFRSIDDKVIKYRGWELFGAQAALDNPILYMFDWQRLNGTRFLIVATKTSIYWYNRNTQLYVQLATGFTGSNLDRWQATVMNDRLHMVNGTNPIQVVSVNISEVPSVAPLASGDAAEPSNARFIINFTDHLLTANTLEGGNNFRTRLRWSDLVDTSIWTSSSTNEAGFLDIDEDGSEILGMALSGPNTCIIYKERSIHKLQYEALPLIFRRTRLTSDEGLAAPYSLVNFRDTHFFLGNKDFYTLTGNTIREIGVKRIRDYFFSTVDREQIQMVYGFEHPRFPEIWWVYRSRFNIAVDISVATGYDRAICYNYELDSWSTRNFFPHSALTSFRVSSGNTLDTLTNTIEEQAITYREKKVAGMDVVLSGTDAGTVMEHGFVLQGDGVDITGTLETGDIYVIDPHTNYQLKRIELGYSHATLPQITDTRVRIGTRFRDSEQITYLPEFKDTTGKIDTRATGKSVRMKVTTTGAFELNHYSFLAKKIGDR